MNTQYKIRAANDADKMQIHRLIRQNIAGEKKLQDPDMVPMGFMEEFVDKVIRKGNMLVVENSDHEMELIGEIHDYHLRNTDKIEDNLREFRFFSRSDSQAGKHETDIVNWLYGEISNKYKDVFRVELTTPVASQASVDVFKKMGLTIKGNFNGRLKTKSVETRLMIPLVWTNPPVN